MLTLEKAVSCSSTKHTFKKLYFGHEHNYAVFLNYVHLHFIFMGKLLFRTFQLVQQFLKSKSVALEKAKFL